MLYQGRPPIVSKVKGGRHNVLVYIMSYLTLYACCSLFSRAKEDTQKGGICIFNEVTTRSPTLYPTSSIIVSSLLISFGLFRNKVLNSAVARITL